MILDNKDIKKEEVKVEHFISNKQQTKNVKKSMFMQDFENGETIEESQNFVLQHINKLWKK